MPGACASLLLFCGEWHGNNRPKMCVYVIKAVENSREQGTINELNVVTFCERGLQ